jgi:hypothetical protein
MRISHYRASRALSALVSFVLALVALQLGVSRPVAQSLTYARGQNISPAFEGWEQAADGHRYFVFGYLNRNWEEEVDVPVGPDNTFTVGGADQGQPTHFLPRRNRFVFRVRVPDGFVEKDEMIWVLTTKGTTEKAYATFRPDLEIDDVVRASEAGALAGGFTNERILSNKPPSVRVEGSTERQVKVGQPLSLVSVVTDDGIPKRVDPARIARLLAEGTRAEGPGGSGQGQGEPGAAASSHARAWNLLVTPPVRPTVRKTIGLHLSWFVYRGAGSVTFNPEQIESWEDTRNGANSPWAAVWFAPEFPPDGRTTTTVTFTKPGEYELRGLADDGALTNFQDIRVVVTP